mgnify:CR=1 FL=1
MDEVVTKKLLVEFPTGKDFLIEASDGKKKFSNSEIFNIYLDQDFRSPKLDKFGPASNEIVLDFYELKSDGNFKEIFNSFGRDLKDICLTQSQMIDFCRKYRREPIFQGYTLFFLLEEKSELEKKNEYFVVFINFFANGISAVVSSLQSNHLWKPKDPRLVVIPRF